MNPCNATEIPDCSILQIIRLLFLLLSTISQIKGDKTQDLSLASCGYSGFINTHTKKLALTNTSHKWDLGLHFTW